MGRLDGKVAIVTGAARGTGAEIARQFDAEGALTTLVDVLDDRGEALAAELSDRARYRHLDVTSEEEWQTVVDEIRAREGRVDVLVNNAAVLHLATIDMTTVEAFERVLRVNCVGPFIGVRTVLPIMRSVGGGSIVNIGSIDSVTGTSLTAAYTTSKFGIRGFTKVIALENRRFGIRANVVCPAAGNPEMHPPVVGWEDLPRRDFAAEDPERMNRGPSAVAPAAVYFASDESRLANGTELVLDGAGSAGIYVELPDHLYVQLEVVTAPEIVLVDIVDRVATVTLNRPESRNALNGELIETMRNRLAECEADDDVDATILTGKDPAFCAGLDLTYLAGRVERDAASGTVAFPESPVPPHTKPIIGAVNGAAVTGGLEVALACDFLVASERARFADTHARVGVVPGWRLTVALPEAIGVRRAKEMSATGNFVDAATALDWGLVNHVVPHQELLPYCQQLGRDIASNDSVTARAIFSLYNDEAEMVDGPRATLELQRFHAWHTEGKSDAAEIERRRAGIVDRGRGQTR